MKQLIRSSAVLCAGLLTVTTLAGSASAATPERDAAGWLADQPTRGVVHNRQYDFDDYSLSADIARALTTTGGERRTVRKIRTALAKNVGAWTGGYAGSPDVYAGQVAKAIVLAQETGAKPRSFGGVDLVAQLEGRVSASGATTGRISDLTESGDDYANVIGQALAAQGLANAKSPLATPALGFLLDQQCAKGYFRLYFADATAADQSCDAGPKVADPDATAMAVLSLQAIEKPTRAVRVSIKDGVRWLKSRQRANGSFGGGVSTKAPNANSTGLAATALGQAGACKPAAKAAGWLRQLQVGNTAPAKRLEREVGAIAYNRAALGDGQKHGIVKETEYQWQLATVQAAPALKYLTKSAC